MTRHAVTRRGACESFMVLLMNFSGLHFGRCQIRSVSESRYQVEWKGLRGPERIAGTRLKKCVDLTGEAKKGFRKVLF